jgi:hypothetical protein
VCEANLKDALSRSSRDKMNRVTYIFCVEDLDSRTLTQDLVGLLLIK